MCLELGKIRKILLEPSKFFRGIKKEKGLNKALTYLGILSLISTVLGVITTFIFQDQVYQFIEALFQAKIPRPELTVQFFIISMVLGYIGAIAGSFIWAGILHVWLLIFGSKENYTKTYQLSVYSGTPGYLFGWLPFVNFFVWIYSVAILIVGTEKICGFSRRKSVAIYLVPLAIFIVLILLVLSVVVSLKTNPLILQNLANRSN